MPLTKIQSLGITDGTIVNADINASAAIASTKLSGVGKVLQVVSTAKTDTFSMSGPTFTDVTGLSASITPSSASNKIMIIVSIMGTSDSINSTFMSRLMRGATAIGISDASGNRIRTTWGTNDTPGGAVSMSISLTFLDSPNTTSATTYKVQLSETRNEGGTVYVNRQNSDSDDVQVPRGISTITVMEIAA
jgi:hypothetical protein